MNRLNEGLIKVNPKLLSTVCDTFKRIIVTRINSVIKEQLNGVEIDDDIRFFYEQELAFIEKYKDYIVDTMKITPSTKEFSFTYTIVPSLLNQPNYPKVYESVNCAFIIYFEDSNSLSAFYTEDVENFDCAIGVNCEKHFSILGKNSDNNNVYSIDYYRVENTLKRIEEIVGHELMHLMQHQVIKSHKIGDVEYTNPEDNYDMYFASDVEFNPHIYSELKYFLMKNESIIDDKEKLMTAFKMFVGMPHHVMLTSAFFNTLKRVNNKRYKVAVRIFFNELIKYIEKKKGA